MTLSYVAGSSGRQADVNTAGELQVANPSAIHKASLLGDAYIVPVRDAGPAAGEYTLYIKNTNPSMDFVISKIWSYGTDADVEWIFGTVTGTAAGASVITAVNLNRGSAKAAELTCRGGAGGVTGLTAATTIAQWFNGVANTTEYLELGNSLILNNGTAVAFEYQAGTGGAAILHVLGYFIDA
jgi:hypothetical protein